MDDVLSECNGWLSEGLPSSDEVQQRFTVVAADLKESMDALGRRTAQDAEDAEAAADPYRAILLHRDPSRSDAPIFEKVAMLADRPAEAATVDPTPSVTLQRERLAQSSGAIVLRAC